MGWSFKPNLKLAAAIAAGAIGYDIVKKASEASLSNSQEFAVPHVRSGNYLDSLTVSVEKGMTVVGPSWIGHIYSDVAYAGFVEFGTSVMAPQAILRRGAEAAGLSIVRARAAFTH
jgi:hypothetical protein